MTLRFAKFISCILCILSLNAQAQSKPMSGMSSPASQNQSEEAWRKADPKRVCMVTDMEFPRDQIPVKVKDKTYYGCCENCKERLGKDAAVRTAIDPVSGKEVDKAKASIAAGPDGAVVYFENDKNLETFIAGKKQAK